MTLVLGVLAIAALFSTFVVLQLADRRPHRCDGCVCATGRCITSTASAAPATSAAVPKESDHA